VIPEDGDPSGLDGTGRFAQIAGFTMVYDSSQPAGSKVVTITLDDATPIVAGGAVMPGAPDLNVAVNSFVAGGGDGYDWGGATFTSLGVSYQQALANFIEDPAGLGGLISAADYPEGGEGRIVNISPALP
jgi:5'-nucleotidase